MFGCCGVVVRCCVLCCVVSCVCCTMWCFVVFIVCCFVCWFVWCFVSVVCVLVVGCGLFVVAIVVVLDCASRKCMSTTTHVPRAAVLCKQFNKHNQGEPERCGTVVNPSIQPSPRRVGVGVVCVCVFVCSFFCVLFCFFCCLLFFVVVCCLLFVVCVLCVVCCVLFHCFTLL